MFKKRGGEGVKTTGAKIAVINIAIKVQLSSRPE